MAGLVRRHATGSCLARAKVPDSPDRDLQRSHELLRPLDLSDVRDRHVRPLPAGGRRLRLASVPRDRRRPGLCLADRAVADAGRLRSDLLPGARARSRHLFLAALPDGPTLAHPDSADRRQHADAASANAGATAAAGHGPRRRRAPRRSRRARRHRRHGRHVAPDPRHALRHDQRAVRPAVPRADRK